MLPYHVWNVASIVLVASEERVFEDVDGEGRECLSFV